MAFFLADVRGKDECYDGVTYFLHCLPECPSGTRQIGNICHQFDLFLVDFDFSDRKNEKFSELISKVPLKGPPEVSFTSDRGLFFSSASRVLFGKDIVLAPFFTAQLWILIIRPGEILSDTQNSFEILSNPINFLTKYNEHSIAIGWENVWTNLIATYEFHFSGTLIMTLYSNSQKSTKHLISSYTTTPRSLILGSLTNSSFSGFLYKFSLINSIFSKSIELHLPECDFSLSPECSSLLTTPHPSTPNKFPIETCCNTLNPRKRKTFCYNYEGSTCKVRSLIQPDFVNYTSDVVDGEFKYSNYYFGGITFPLWKNNVSSIVATDKVHQLIPYSTLKGFHMRGQYFDGNQFFVDSPNIAIFSRFWMVFWIRSVLDSFLLFEKNGITMSVELTLIRIKYGKEYIFTNKFYNKLAWNSLTFGLSTVPGNITDSYFSLSAQVNGKSYSQLISSTFTPFLSTLYLGTNSSQVLKFKGWMYLFQYSIFKAPVNNNFKEIKNNCYTYPDNNINCLSSCNNSQYLSAQGICTNCSSSCEDCLTSSQCFTCFDPVCASCSEYQVCEICATGFSFNGICYPECPFNTKSSNQSCIAQDEVQFFNFTQDGLITSPDSMFLDHLTGPDPVYLLNRGNYFGKNSYFRTSEKFYFAFEFKVLIMIRAQVLNQVSVGVPGVFNVQIKNNGIYIEINSASYYNTSFSDPAGWKSIMLRSRYHQYLDECNKTEYTYDLDFPIPLYDIRLQVFGSEGFKQSFTQFPSLRYSDHPKRYLEIKTLSNSSALIYILAYNTKNFKLTQSTQHYMNEISLDYPLKCSISEYYNSTTLSCSPCPSPCITCHNSTTCATSLQVSLLNFSVSECPTFYYFDGNFCISLDETGADFKLESLKGKISDGRNSRYMNLKTSSENNWPDFNFSVDPVPGMGRGMYFASERVFLNSSSAIILSPEMFFGFWVNPAFGPLLYKNSVLVSIEGAKVLVKVSFGTLSASYTASELVKIGVWNFLSITTQYTSTQTIIYIYTNQVK